MSRVSVTVIVGPPNLTREGGGREKVDSGEGLKQGGLS